MRRHPASGGRDPAAVRRRAVWLVAGVSAVAVVVLFVLPGRTWLEQRTALASTSRQLQVLSTENAKLARAAADLRTDAEIERLARERYGLVMPGQQAYVVLPPAPGVPAGEADPPSTTVPAPASSGSARSSTASRSSTTSRAGASGHPAGSATTSTTTSGRG